MELRYFIRIPDIAAAETDGAAQRLVSRGFKECPRRYYITWWTLKDLARGAELGRTRRHVSPPISRAVGALPPGYGLPSRW